MFNAEKLKIIVASYKKDFPKTWLDEKYKWEMVKYFQDNWDINASNFAEMLKISLAKTNNLLTSQYFYPGGMLVEFAKVAPEDLRAMFINLFDETKDIGQRLENFQDDSEKLRNKYGEVNWKNHYQNANSISTYLWLRYPNKYYIYKYGVCSAVAKEIESDFKPKKGNGTKNFIGVFELYNEINEQLLADKELIQLLKANITDTCYPDEKLKTLTIDLGYYIKSQIIPPKSEDDKWFPADYTPNISVDKWSELLADKSVFYDSSLEIMKRMKDYGEPATCTQLTNKYGESMNFYNAGSSSLAKRIADKTNCPLFNNNLGSSKWWPIIYLGKNASKEMEGSYMWKLRDELSEALDKFDLSNVSLYAKPIVPVIPPYTKEDFLKEVFITSEEFDDLILLLKNKQNLILQGAPGVGKTFAAKRLAYAMMQEKDENRVEFIQFHQNYTYEDFVMGYKPKGDSFELQNGVFYKFCLKAINSPDEPFFFIIDEINRGNMSKIFGELLMLIEKDYRGTEATLAYNGLKFTVPENLYIIGMMNTADRSLAMIDYALRRRFSFFEMVPNYNSDGFSTYQNSLANETLDAIIENIIQLNKEITNDSSLGKGFCIGHSYFCGQNECQEAWLNEVVEYDIIPMLKEYWFDEQDKLQYWTNKLRGVLNE